MESKNFEEIFNDRLEKMRELNIPLPQNVDEFRVYSRELKRNNLASSIYLEIGSRHGGSLYLAAGFLPKGSTIIAIDLPNSAWGIEGSETKLAETCDRLKAEGYECFQILSDSRDPKTIDELIATLKGRKIDALFLDGDHSFAGIKADWDNYFQFIRVGGMVGFHDVREDDRYPKVQVAAVWNDLKKEYPHLEVIFEHGIGILWNNKLL